MPLRQDAIGDGEGLDCSVLVPVLNEERFIAASVRAMQAQRFPGEVEFLFADGGSSDSTRAILAELQRHDSRIRVLDNPGGSTASGLNVALAHARGRWVARMDAHAQYEDDYLALGVRRLERGDTSWVSGPAVPTGGGRVSRAVALGLRTWLGRGGSRKWSSGGDGGPETELDSGVFAGVWERRMLLDLGGWDEHWLRNEDSEMAGRFLERGERLVLVPGMAARYSPRDSVRTLWRQYFRYGEYRTKTAVRHPLTVRRSHLLAPSLVVACAAAVVSPSPVRRVARAGLGLYAAAVAGASVTVASEAGDMGEALLVPVVLAAMHLAHGAGALYGLLRYGPPVGGVALAIGCDRLARCFTPPREIVFAPSLRREGIRK